MPKLRKDDVDDLDIDALEEADYEEGGSFTNYEGEIPPAGTNLTGFLKAMWWLRTAKDDIMIKVLWEAADNDGPNKEYDGLPIWDNLALIPGAKFRWKPFIDQFGITLSDIKTKTYVAEEDDNVGPPIEKIGSFVPGEDNDDAWCRVITGKEKYQNEWQARIKTWLPFDAIPESEDEDEPEPEDPDLEEDLEPETVPEPAPARGRRKAPAAVKEDPEPTVPARGRRAATETAEPATPTRGRGRTSPAKASGRGRTAAAPAEDKPPF